MGEFYNTPEMVQHGDGLDKTLSQAVFQYIACDISVIGAHPILLRLGGRHHENQGARQLRIEAQFFEKLYATHARHIQVKQYQVRGRHLLVAVLTAQNLQCLDTVARVDHGIGDLQLIERTLDGHRHDFVVVDQENGNRIAIHGPASRHVKTKVVPRAGGALSIQIRPPLPWTFFLTIASPMPLDFGIVAVCERLEDHENAVVEPRGDAGPIIGDYEIPCPIDQSHGDSDTALGSVMVFHRIVDQIFQHRRESAGGGSGSATSAPRRR